VPCTTFVERLRARLRRHRAEAAWLALSLRAITTRGDVCRGKLTHRGNNVSEENLTVLAAGSNQDVHDLTDLVIIGIVDILLIRFSRDPAYKLRVTDGRAR
jgi:hypothetical protein